MSFFYVVLSLTLFFFFEIPRRHRGCGFFPERSICSGWIRIYAGYCREQLLIWYPFIITGTSRRFFFYLLLPRHISLHAIPFFHGVVVCTKSAKYLDLTLIYGAMPWSLQQTNDSNETKTKVRKTVTILIGDYMLAMEAKRSAEKWKIKFCKSFSSCMSQMDKIIILKLVKLLWKKSERKYLLLTRGWLAIPYLFSLHLNLYLNKVEFLLMQKVLVGAG